MKNARFTRIGKWTLPGVLAIALFAVAAEAQEVVSVRASATANHSEKVKKTKEDGFVWMDVQAKDTYRASVSFTLDTTPADWSLLANDIYVSVGNIDCQPEITKSRANGGMAKLKEKDKEYKSTLTCTVKWSRNTVTVSLSGSNFDGDTFIDDDDVPNINEEVDVSIDVGNISCEATLFMRGTRRIQLKTVTSGRGEDAEIEDFELFNWKASGTARTTGGSGGSGGGTRLRLLMR